MVAVSWIFRSFSYGSVDRWFRRAQLFSAALFSLSHGTNDAQKTMGIIAGLLVANQKLFADPVLVAPLDAPAGSQKPSRLDHAFGARRDRASGRSRAAGGSSGRWDRGSRS